MFSSEHERLSAEKAERIEDAFKGIEKLEEDAVSKRGILVPAVAFWNESMLTTVHPDTESSGLLHDSPVKPLTQTQPQEDEETMEIPLLLQGWLDAQLERSKPVDVWFWRGRTIRTIGITTAAATSSTRRMRMRANAQTGRPQHRRLPPFLLFKDSCLGSLVTDCASRRFEFELIKGDGQRDTGRSLDPVGLLAVGSGKDVSISEIEWRAWFAVCKCELSVREERDSTYGPLYPAG